DLNAGGIDAEMVVVLGTPLQIAEQLLVFCPALVNLTDLFLQLLITESLAVIGSCPAAGQLGGHIRINEDLHGMELLQNDTGGTAYHHAVSLLGQAFDDGLLQMQYLQFVLHDGVKAQRKAVAEGGG